MSPSTSGPASAGTGTELSTPHRLSILVTGRGRRARIERCLASLLTQSSDPIGTEVVVAAPGAQADELRDSLKTAFPEAFFERRLRVVEAPASPSPLESPLALLRAAAEAAEGAYLALVNPRDRWRPDALQTLAPHLYGNDLILSAREEQAGSPSSALAAQSSGRDWVQALVEENFAAPSGGLIRRTLWDAALSGLPQNPSPLLADEYAIYLKALLELSAQGLRERFHLLPAPGILQTRSAEAADDPWLATLPAPIRRLESHVTRTRETLSALRLARKLPLRYWPALGRRLKPGKK